MENYFGYSLYICYDHAYKTIGEDYKHIWPNHEMTLYHI